MAAIINYLWYKSMMRLIIIAALAAVTSQSLLAANVKTLPALSGGINIANVLGCDKKYENAESTNMAKDPDCKQAAALREVTGNPITEIKKSGNVTIFEITTMADGIETFYMIDKDGKLISLTTDLDISGDTYKKIMKTYPKAKLTTMLYWTKFHEDLFPIMNTTPTGNDFVFRQTLRDGGCVACAIVGLVDVAYQFTLSGVYLGTKVLQVEMYKTK